MVAQKGIYDGCAAVVVFMKFERDKQKRLRRPWDAGRSFAETIQIMISVKLINSVSSKKTDPGEAFARIGFQETDRIQFCMT